MEAKRLSGCENAPGVTERVRNVAEALAVIGTELGKMGGAIGSDLRIASDPDYSLDTVTLTVTFEAFCLAEYTAQARLKAEGRA